MVFDAEPEILFQLVPPFREYSQWSTEPQAGLVDVRFVLFVAEHMSTFVEDVIFPVDELIDAVVVDGAGRTETIFDVACTTLQVPLVNVPRNWYVVVKHPEVVKPDVV
jgi:hypothetical protein